MWTQVKVATINLRNRANRWPERRHLLVEQVLETLPDLLALQEIYLPIGQGRWLCNQINYRLRTAAERPYALIQKRYQHPFKRYLQAVGIMSRLPILYHDYINLGYGGRIAARVHVDLPSHQTMDFVTTQFHHIPYEREARNEQAMKLVGWLHSHKHVPIQVVAGDFNELPNGLAIQYLKQSFRSSYEAVYGQEPLATFPTALYQTEDPAACVDYIFVSPAVRRVRSAAIFCDQPSRTDDTLYPSDHVGLLATLEV